MFFLLFEVVVVVVAVVLACSFVVMVLLFVVVVVVVVMRCDGVVIGKKTLVLASFVHYRRRKKALYSEFKQIEPNTSRRFQSTGYPHQTNSSRIRTNDFKLGTLSRLRQIIIMTCMIYSHSMIQIFYRRRVPNLYILRGSSRCRMGAVQSA